MNVNSFDKIGYTGYNMINGSISRMDELAETMDKDDPASVAKTNVEITKQKARMYQGMALVQAHRELVNSTLILFGIGCRCNCDC